MRPKQLRLLDYVNVIHVWISTTSFKRCTCDSSPPVMQNAEIKWKYKGRDFRRARRRNLNRAQEVKNVPPLLA
jgi:hypothetical protein